LKGTNKVYTVKDCYYISKHTRTPWHSKLRPYTIIYVCQQSIGIAILQDLPIERTAPFEHIVSDWLLDHHKINTFVWNASNIPKRMQTSKLPDGEFSRLIV
jgi:hypothetical protein